MPTITLILQIVIALGLLNVWLLRFKKSTQYRGGDSKNLIDEFAAYGLPKWFCYIIGALKVGSALALIAGFWFPELIRPSALIVTALMFGALGMHLKVSDPFKKSVPALCMLIMSAFVLFS